MVKYMQNIISLFVICCMVIIIASCSSYSGEMQYAYQSTPTMIHDYHLQTGDSLAVTVFEEEGLSGEYKIDGSGNVTLPLVGTIDVAGKDMRAIKDDITLAYSQNYLKDPNITVEVAQYRPFYILGEVKKPGQYPYTENMTILNAVALSGGFTYRASRKKTRIKRSVISSDYSTKTITYLSDLNSVILPGDVVEIGERLF